MTASELKHHVEKNDSPNYFFSRKTMKFFGDTMRNYGVRSAKINTYSELDIDCWELYRRRSVKMGLSSSAYFRKSDYTQAFRKTE